VTWKGAFIGALESGALGFAMGYAAAGLRNIGVGFYAARLQRRARARAESEVLDKV